MAIGVPEGTQSVQLSDVTADRPNDAWAIGSARAENQAAFEPVVEHWNGSVWSMLALPASALKVMGAASPRATIGASSQSNVWAFGIGGSWLHWLWHFSNGQWQGPYPPRIGGTATSVADLVQVPGTTSLWGAGGRTVGSRQQGMILLQGSWPGTVKPAPAHEKAAPARWYSPPARPVAPPNPCPAR